MTPLNSIVPAIRSRPPSGEQPTCGSSSISACRGIRRGRSSKLYPFPASTGSLRPNTRASDASQAPGASTTDSHRWRPAEVRSAVTRERSTSTSRTSVPSRTSTPSSSSRALSPASSDAGRRRRAARSGTRRGRRSRAPAQALGADRDRGLRRESRTRAAEAARGARGSSAHAPAAPRRPAAATRCNVKSTPSAASSSISSKHRPPSVPSTNGRPRGQPRCSGARTRVATGASARAVGARSTTPSWDRQASAGRSRPTPARATARPAPV